MNELSTALSSLQKSEVTKTIVFGENVIVLKPWKTRDERNFLIKKASLPKNIQENVDKVHDLLVDDLIKPCIVSGDINSLSFNQLKLIMIELRMLSIGEEVEGINFKCQECGKSEEITITFDDSLVKFEEGDFSIQEINESLKIKFKPIPHTLMRNKIDEMTILYSVVEEIIFNDVVYKDFTKKDFIDFFDALDLKTTKNIIKKLGSTADNLTIKQERICNHCGANNVLDFGELPNFYIP